MHIAPVSFRLYANSKNSFQNGVGNSLPRQNHTQSIPKDEVTFGASKACISDYVWRAFSKGESTLKSIAVPYLDTVEAVAKQHLKDGIVFARETFEANVVKDTDARLSKVLRAKTFEDRDAIRTTLYVKNPYDLSILFDKLIPSFGPEAGRNYLVAPISTSVRDMMERGYVPFEEQNLIMQLLELPNTKEAYQKFLRGIKSIKYDYYGVERPLYDVGDTRRILVEYLKNGSKPETKSDMVELIKSLKKEIPDIDIRLDPKMVDLSSISEERKLFLGKPHGTYEDIQIRFIRCCDKSADNPIYHELLIQFGPNYNKNARKEHQIVYEPMRLFSTLRMPKVANYNDPAIDVSNPQIVASKAIGELQEDFRRRVSDRLLLNGKNLDFYGDSSQKRVFFSDTAKKRFNELFEIINSSLGEYYTGLKSTAKNYSIIRQLTNDERADIAKLTRIKRMLEETIQTVNQEYNASDIEGVTNNLL